MVVACVRLSASEASEPRCKLAFGWPCHAARWRCASLSTSRGAPSAKRGARIHIPCGQLAFLTCGRTCATHAMPAVGAGVAAARVSMYSGQRLKGASNNGSLQKWSMAQWLENKWVAWGCRCRPFP